MLGSSWRLETNLLSVLPKALNSKVAAAEQALFSESEKQILVLFSGKDAHLAYQQLSEQLSVETDVEIDQAPLATLEDISRFYLPYRHNFLSTSYIENLHDPEKLRQLVASQLIQLTNPLISEAIAQNPRLNLPNYLQEELKFLGELESENGIPSITFEQKQYLILRLKVSMNGYSLNDSQQLSQKLKKIFHETELQYSTELFYSGILFHTAESASQAKKEISTFGVFSILAVIFLILFVFKSIYPLITALGIIAVSSFYGFTAVLVFFNKVHLLTLVFAVTLIGVVIDYCFHYFTYASSATAQANKSIQKPLILGFITTALGYFALIFSPLELLSQVALFMIFGLLGALLIVLMWLPYQVKLNNNGPTRLSLVISSKCMAIYSKLVTKKCASLILICSSIGILTLFNPLKFNDDIRLLNTSPQWLLNTEMKINQIFKREQSTKLIITADNIEQLLQRQEQLIKHITTTKDGLTIKSLSGLLPSSKNQKAHYDLLTQADISGNFDLALAYVGLDIALGEFAPLTYEKFLNGPFSNLAQLFIAPLTDSPTGTKNNKIQGYALWLDIPFNELSPKNKQWIASTKHISIFDKAADVTTSLSIYRSGIFNLLCISILIVLAVLLLKYGLVSGAVASIIIICSSLVALIASQLILGHLNIFNLLAMLLIIALAIDYIIFYQEHGLKPETFLAISLSAISSTLVFGVLIFSKTPAVSSFGLTVMVGIVTIYILAPISISKK